MKDDLLVLNFSSNDISQIVTDNLIGRISISGVQRKISLVKSGDTFIPVDTAGEYILKPLDNNWDQLPENEKLCMDLASFFNLKVPENFLVRLAEGSIAYVVKRFDRNGLSKYPVEDFCQILDLSNKSKYSGSYEKIIKALEQYSSAPGLDKIMLFRSLIFNFLICNNDAHYKNYSLLNTGNGYRLSPFYDLVNTSLVLKNNNEEVALTMNGKRSNLRKEDMLSFAEYAEIPSKVIAIEFESIRSTRNKFIECISNSFLSKKNKDKFVEFYLSRYDRLI